jgi:hypothetical protein
MLVDVDYLRFRKFKGDNIRIIKPALLEIIYHTKAQTVVNCLGFYKY